jgi:hypothetical protein
MTMANARTEAAQTRLALRLGALLEFVEPATAERVGARLGISALVTADGLNAADAEAVRRETIATLVARNSYQSDGSLPVGVLGWMLERDDPELNAAIARDHRLPQGIQRDIMHGVPFGVAAPLPGAHPLPALPVTAKNYGVPMDYPNFKPTTSGDEVARDEGDARNSGRFTGLRADTSSAAGPAATAAFVTGSASVSEPEPGSASASATLTTPADGLTDSTTPDDPGSGRPEFPDPDPTGLIAALREAGAGERIAPARRLARQVCRADWEPIAAADRDLPLGGYVRWALSTRPDCPDWLRVQFGSWQPRFVKRMHKAGIHRDLTRYLTEDTTARAALEVLAFGRWAFANRIAEACDIVGGRVRGELGENVEAWAVFVQLLPDFTGTLPELLTTAGAIAYSA